MTDAIDELVARSKDHPELRKFHSFHRENTHVLDFLCHEARLRLERGLKCFSMASLLHYARWSLLDVVRISADSFKINDHFSPWYARAVIILHPHLFNGRVELRRSSASNVILGVKVADSCLAAQYSSRLMWADGTEITEGWRPTIQHEIKPVVLRRPSIH